MAKLLLSRLATFGAAAILSALLLMIYPYYPLYIVIILALAMGAIGLEFPNIALILAILLSVFGALYQDASVGLTFWGAPTGYLAMTVIPLLSGIAPKSFCKPTHSLWAPIGNRPRRSPCVCWHLCSLPRSLLPLHNQPLTGLPFWLRV